MATGTVRLKRGGRAGRHPRPVLFVDAALLLPAAVWLAWGGYARHPDNLGGLLALLLAGFGFVRRGLSSQRRPEGAPGAALAALTVLVPALAVLQMVGPAVVPMQELGLLALLGLTTYHTIGRRPAAPVVAFPTAQRTAVHAPMAESAALEGEADLPPVLQPALALTRSSCAATSVVLLELEPGGESLRVVAAAPVELVGQVVDARVGLLGSVLRSWRPVVAQQRRGEGVGGAAAGSKRHVLALPVGGAGSRRILVVERDGAAPFEEADTARAQEASALLNAALVAQRRVARTMDAKEDLERFFEASRLLNSALSPDQVYASTNQALRLIADFQVWALVWMEDPQAPLRVVHAGGDGMAPLVGRTVDGERSLAAMVVKSGHYLPLGCDYRPDSAPVLCGDEELGVIESLVVLPLRLHDRMRGALAVGARQPGAIPHERRGMLEVIANQVAVSLANARAYARVEEMATVDPLTSLYNRRSFNQRLDEALARSTRGNKPLSLVLLDIDHFKSVNDTHGHPAGDAVLREIGATVHRLLRRTDTAARYGGEEFALILEETDARGAFVMAERLREEAQKLSFAGAKGVRFRVALSLGIAAWPLDGGSAAELVSRADEALYDAKHRGRNQTRLAQQLRPAPAGITDLARLGSSPGSPP